MSEAEKAAAALTPLRACMVAGIEGQWSDSAARDLQTLGLMHTDGAFWRLTAFGKEVRSVLLRRHDAAAQVARIAELEARAQLHDQWASAYEPGTVARARHEFCAKQFRAGAAKR